MDEFAPLVHLTQRALNKLQEFRLRKTPFVVENEIIQSTVGYKIATARCRVTSPEKKSPGLLICPDNSDGLKSISQKLITELLSKGIEVWLFDPAGRGDSWGAEDHGGAEHQNNVSCLLEHMAPHVSKMAILGLGNGSAMAIGGANAYPHEIAGVIDYEGPATSIELSNDLSKRNPSALLVDLRCPYIRLQSSSDHHTGHDLRHCREMMRIAQKCPNLIFQLNNHPPNQFPARPQWLLSGASTANKVITLKAVQLLGST